MGGPRRWPSTGRRESARARWSVISLRRTRGGGQKLVFPADATRTSPCREGPRRRHRGVSQHLDSLSPADVERGASDVSALTRVFPVLLQIRAFADGRREQSLGTRRSPADPSSGVRGPRLLVGRVARDGRGGVDRRPAVGGRRRHGRARGAAGSRPQPPCSRCSRSEARRRPGSRSCRALVDARGAGRAGGAARRADDRGRSAGGLRRPALSGGERERAATGRRLTQEAAGAPSSSSSSPSTRALPGGASGRRRSRGCSTTRLDALAQARLAFSKRGHLRPPRAPRSGMRWRGVAHNRQSWSPCCAASRFIRSSGSSAASRPITTASARLVDGIEPGIHSIHGRMAGARRPRQRRLRGVFEHYRGAGDAGRAAAGGAGPHPGVHRPCLRPRRVVVQRGPSPRAVSAEVRRGARASLGPSPTRAARRSGRGVPARRGQAGDTPARWNCSGEGRPVPHGRSRRSRSRPHRRGLARVGLRVPRPAQGDAPVLWRRGRLAWRGRLRPQAPPRTSPRTPCAAGHVLGGGDRPGTRGHHRRLGFRRLASADGPRCGRAARSRGAGLALESAARADRRGVRASWRTRQQGGACAGRRRPRRRSGIEHLSDGIAARAGRMDAGADTPEERCRSCATGAWAPRGRSTSRRTW